MSRIHKKEKEKNLVVLELTLLCSSHLTLCPLQVFIVAATIGDFQLANDAAPTLIRLNLAQLNSSLATQYSELDEFYRLKLVCFEATYLLPTNLNSQESYQNQHNDRFVRTFTCYNPVFQLSKKRSPCPVSGTQVHGIVSIWNETLARILKRLSSIATYDELLRTPSDIVASLGHCSVCTAHMHDISAQYSNFWRNEKSRIPLPFKVVRSFTSSFAQDADDLLSNTQAYAGSSWKE